MNDHIRELRTAMKKRGIRLFTAVTSDAHGSEYISEHDNAVEYISGFTGTNGKTTITYLLKHLLLNFSLHPRYISQTKIAVSSKSFPLHYYC